ncbi:hypothetical protein HELRODRAFT_188635 [Helobdella robusta]|uniref:Major facilitator superfamily (MFS) profile domain-containing protein n=1 Tax=Helobdella robusta TaxID=6412 RepID=T1FQ72_HELRO|nr:hypothetical protein HELRODRAFT_188635 [Helobdella robusta]ESO02250.1 hypothetical protein HELRODRAFT_188635 [Helobdella robusta]
MAGVHVSTSQSSSSSSTAASYSSSFIYMDLPVIKSKLSLTKLLGLNAIVCGIEFCGSAAFCFIPPMLLKAGISEQYMSMVLGVGPLMGIFLVPIIGRSSDKCTSQFGRRRPYILLLSIVLLFSLFILLTAKYIGTVIVGGGEVGRFTTILFLVIGSVFLDFTCQVCLTPCEALLSDLSKDTDQHGKCFTVYSFMISFGGCVGYLITALDWSGSYVGTYFGTQENCIFITLIIMYIISMFLTFNTAKEIPLRDILKINSEKMSISSMKPADLGYVSDEPANEDSNHADSLEFNVTISVPFTKWSTINLTNLKQHIISTSYSMLPTVLKRLFNIPYVLRQLALANFCSWTAVMIFNLFYTDYIGQSIYKGDPNAPEDSELRNWYDEGVRMGSWGLLWHCILSAIYSTFIDRIASNLNLQKTYLIGMASFTVSLFIMLFANDIWLANICATCTGFGYATLTTVPYLLLTAYHDNSDVYFCDTHNGCIVPYRGIGADLSILDSAYFLSQVMLTGFMGYIVQHCGSVLAYIVCSSFMGLLSLFCIFNIVYEPNQMTKFLKNSKRVVK